MVIDGFWEIGNRKPVRKVLISLFNNSMLGTVLCSPPSRDSTWAKSRLFGNLVFLQPFEEVIEASRPRFLKGNAIDACQFNRHVAIRQIVDVERNDIIWDLLCPGDTLRQVEFSERSILYVRRSGEHIENL